jgi:TPP-dependent pyruvate/acetoin dehydrogenase alpha subunit
LSDPDYRYRAKDAGADWLATNDPLTLLRGRLDTDETEAVDEEVTDAVAAAIATAEVAEPTPTAEASTNLYATPGLSDA